ncbi:MAG: DUF1343 domain-containing protein [Acidimicrobiia bacterium]|nr:DUF1343 domain-containing protein [Acidimicrobiia bacterium]
MPLASELLAGKRVGVVSNPASVDNSYAHVVDRLAAAPAVTLAALFGPQHGFRSDVQENMIETDHAQDDRRRVPVYSLYSETRQPTDEMLRGMDVLVIDLQDVGTRIYTYIYTMANCLIAAKRCGVKVVVCDRPNPIGGDGIEGPILAPGYESFVGMYPIPMRHGMTIGELARLFNDHFGIGAELHVVPMRGWTRSMYHDDTMVPWVLPSPNLPTLDGAIVYPGTVLFEGTNVSEGRGTTRPFELVGTPEVVPEAFAEGLNRTGLPGVFFRPAVFEPTFHKHAKRPCGGCQIHVLDRNRFRPVLTGVALIAAFRRADSSFAWRQPPYEYEHIKLPFDILAGSSELREQIEFDVPVVEIGRSWESGVAAFDQLRRTFLMY